MEAKLISRSIPVVMIHLEGNRFSFWMSYLAAQSCHPPASKIQLLQWDIEPCGAATVQSLDTNLALNLNISAFFLS